MGGLLGMLMSCTQKGRLTGSSEELLQLDSMKTVMEKVFSAHNGEWFQT